MSDSIEAWIKQARQAGISDDKITNQLTQNGWPPEQIEKYYYEEPPPHKKSLPQHRGHRLLGKIEN